MALPHTPAVLTDGDAWALETASPANKNAQLGARVQELQANTLYIQRVPVTADASAGTGFAVEVSGELVDMWVVCTSSNASGTLGIRRVATALTTLVACVTVDVEARTALLLQSGKTLVAGETLNVKANGAADRGVVYLAILRS